MKKQFLYMLALMTSLSCVSSIVHASDKGHYKVTITNLTRGSLLTPALVVSHEKGVRIFEEGEAASNALAQLAEGGNTAPIEAELFATGKAKDAKNTGPIFPGKSVTVMIAMDDDASMVSLVSMVLPTNDGFIALNGVRGAKSSKGRVYYLPAYDAGSELNDEHCTSIPGPHCGGEPFNAAGGEGYVHIHAGIHGTGDLVAADTDWRNPVAKVVIEKVK